MEKAMAKKRKAVKKVRRTAKPRGSAGSRQSSQDEGFLAAFMSLFGEPDSAKKRKQ
jgi:hypothetical protein